MSFCDGPVRLDVGETCRSKGANEMQYLLMIYQNEAEYGKIDAAAGKKMLEEYGAFTQSISRAAISRPATGCSRRRRRPPCASATARP